MKTPYGDFVSGSRMATLKERYPSKTQAVKPAAGSQLSPVQARMQAMKKRLGGK